jgi:hypothetical protein
LVQSSITKSLFPINGCLKSLALGLRLKKAGGQRILMFAKIIMSPLVKEKGLPYPRVNQYYAENIRGK